MEPKRSPYLPALD